MNNCILFYQYAGNRINIWKRLEGQEVTHATFGRGIITKIKPKEQSDTFYIWVRFENDSKSKRQFTTDSFRKGKIFSNLKIPKNLKSLTSTNYIGASKQERIYPSQRKEQQTKNRIQEICTQRKITTLFHFTYYKNLSSILKNGLHGRDILETWPQNHQPRYNDAERLDGHKEAICLSISFPNYKMFYKYRQKNPSEWVVLLLESSILWKLKCAFFDDNAASKRAKKNLLTEKLSYASFKMLFSDYEKIRRNDLQIPDSYPTNPQAEVLVFQPIPPTYIKKVHFYCKKSLDQWLSENSGINLRILYVNRRYFQPRKDWNIWSTSY